mmetsp:Transcript_24448/g.60861  ORF Transcript_24448/g.60861 Transcript_24448/m.60861 type:complete len:280 (+) Transcript_24448:851-1690(+)
MPPPATSRRRTPCSATSSSTSHRRQRVAPRPPRRALPPLPLPDIAPTSQAAGTGAAAGRAERGPAAAAQPRLRGRRRHARPRGSPRRGRRRPRSSPPSTPWLAEIRLCTTQPRRTTSPRCCPRARRSWTSQWSLRRCASPNSLRRRNMCSRWRCRVAPLKARRCKPPCGRRAPRKRARRRRRQPPPSTELPLASASALPHAPAAAAAPALAAAAAVGGGREVVDASPLPLPPRRCFPALRRACPQPRRCCTVDRQPPVAGYSATCSRRMDGDGGPGGIY